MDDESEDASVYQCPECDSRSSADEVEVEHNRFECPNCGAEIDPEGFGS